MKSMKQYFPSSHSLEIDRSGEPLCNRVSRLPEVPNAIQLQLPLQHVMSLILGSYKSEQDRPSLYGL